MLSNVMVLLFLPLLTQDVPSPPADDFVLVDESDAEGWDEVAHMDDEAQRRAEEAQAREEEAREREQEAKERAEEAKERAQEAEERLEELYTAAQDDMDEGRWDSTIRRLDEHIRGKGKRADGALYWKAYAQNKRGQSAESLATLAELRKSFPQSRWLGDAKALEVEMRGGTGQPVRPEPGGDEEMKLLVINSLMHTDPEQALPVLEKLLSTSTSPRIRERALFVLCQSGSPKAREIVGRIARGGNPDLQLKAIKYLGMFGGSESRQILSDLYGSASDVSVKKTILQSFMVSGEKTRLLAAAKGETNPELRRAAIQQLGVMGAQAELWDMYRTETSQEMKKAMIQGFFVGGSVERMIELARTEKDLELRHTAIRNIGLMGGNRAGDVLVSLYGGETNREIRKHVIEALFLQGNAKALVEIGRKESDPQLKKEIVTKLSHMNAKDATDFLLEILNK
jgi:HEAT repeat protein